MSTIGEEKQYNTRIQSDTSLEGFIDTMNALHLPPPKYLDVALPANLSLDSILSKNKSKKYVKNHPLCPGYSDIATLHEQ